VISDLHAEIMAATGIRKRPAWTIQDYYEKLAKAGNRLSDEEWNALSAEAQVWFDAAIRCFKEDQPIGAIDPQIARPRRAPGYNRGSHGAMAQVRQMMIADINNNIETIREQLDKDGLKISDTSIKSVISDYHATIRALTEAGCKVIGIGGAEIVAPDPKERLYFGIYKKTAAKAAESEPAVEEVAVVDEGKPTVTRTRLAG
jgi:hypothetical protein